MKESYTEFTNKLLRKYDSKKHAITNSYGVFDAFKYYRKIKPKDKKYVLTESQYFGVIKTINKALVDDFFEGNMITFPEKMGGLELHKHDSSPSIDKDGKLKLRTSIDWEATNKLWYEDEEARNEKILIKRENKYSFTIFYTKFRAYFINQRFYKFRPTRAFNVRLKEAIKADKIDAIELNYF